MVDAMHILAMLGPDTVEQWLMAGGYLVLFGVLFACGLGFPMPEDVPLIAAGIMIANGHMHWVPAACLAWCGIIGGDLVLYHIGRKFGPNITRVPFVGKHINVQRLAWVERKFERYGIWVVAVGRLFAGVRGAMVVVAGTIRYNRLKFVIADGLAAIVSGGTFMILGYWLGQNLDHLMRLVHQGKWWMGGIATLAAAIGAVWWYRRRHTPKPDHPPSPPSSSPSSASAEAVSPGNLQDTGAR